MPVINKSPQTGLEPAWIANLEASLAGAFSSGDYENAPYDLLRLAHKADAWLDTNMVKGSVQNRRTAARLYRAIRFMADFELLDIDKKDDEGKLIWGGLAAVVHKATSRLRKVLAAS